MQAAQIAHAIGESLEKRHEEGTYVVILAAKDELELTQIADRLDRAGVKFARVYEPDAPWNGALMALGLVPARKEGLRRHLSSIPLLR